MKLFVVPLLILAMASGSFSHSKLNKTPKFGWTDACDECQTIVKRIAEVAKNPTKVEELKILLSALCHETSYEEECRLFVSKLDLFLDRLLPYLRDAHHVCRELHICANSKLEQFHRVGMLYARQLAKKEENAPRDLICEECQIAARELSHDISDPKFQQEVLDWLKENVCAHFGSLKDTCDEYLTDFMPEMWTELENILADQKKFCQELELCPTAFGHRHHLLRHLTTEDDGTSSRRRALKQKVSRHLLLANDE